MTIGLRSEFNRETSIKSGIRKCLNDWSQVLKQLLQLPFINNSFGNKSFNYSKMLQNVTMTIAVEKNVYDADLD